MIPDPKDLQPSRSDHFHVGGGWMTCPSLFQMEGARIVWHWHPEREAYGLEVTTDRSFPGMGPITVHLRLTPDEAEDQPRIEKRLGELLHETVALRAMG